MGVKLILLITICFELCFNVISDPSDFHDISPKPVINWGTYGDMVTCPGKMQFVQALYLKFHEVGLYDNTGANGISFSCGVPGILPVTKRFDIRNKEGVHGDWVHYSDWTNCSNHDSPYFVAFQLAIQPYQGYYHDDMGTIAIRLYCLYRVTIGSSNGIPSLGYDLTSYIESPNFAGAGKWTEVVMCRDGYAICGFNTQIETVTGYDDTSLNGVIMRCCKIDGLDDL